MGESGVKDHKPTCVRKYLGHPGSFTNKTDRHDKIEIWVKVALETINQTYSCKPICLSFINLITISRCE